MYRFKGLAMKKVVLILLLLAGAGGARAQATAPADSVLVSSHPGSDNEELQQLMSQVLHVEKYHFAVHNASRKARRFHITYQEYKNGTPGPEKELVGNVERLMSFDRQGDFAMDVFARQATETTLLNQFLFAAGSTEKSFTAVPGASNRYSLRQDIWPYKNRKSLGTPAPGAQPTVERYFPVGKKVPFLVYTLPYEDKKAGYFLYCSLAQSKTPVSSWFQQFNIAHFVVYNLVVE